MEKVRTFIGLGMSPTAAIKAALRSDDGGRAPLKIGDFVDKYKLRRELVSSAINGKQEPTQKMVDALIAELGGTDYEWRYLMWAVGEPEKPYEAKTLMEVLPEVPDDIEYPVFEKDPNDFSVNG